MIPKNISASTKKILLISFIALIKTEMFRIQFTVDFDLYLTLYNYKEAYLKSPKFIATSLNHIYTLNNHCGKCSMRRIDDDVYEFYFCGYKMCYNEEDRILLACEGDEYNTKWELEKVDPNAYCLRNNNYCITLKYGRVVMEECMEGVAINQILKILQDNQIEKFQFSDDDSVENRKHKVAMRFHDNENRFRMESIVFGGEGWHNGIGCNDCAMGNCMPCSMPAY